MSGRYQRTSEDAEGTRAAPLLKFDGLFDGDRKELFEEEEEEPTGGTFFPSIPDEYTILWGIRIYPCLIPCFCVGMGLVVVLLGAQIVDTHAQQQAKLAKIVAADLIKN